MTLRPLLPVPVALLTLVAVSIAGACGKKEEKLSEGNVASQAEGGVSGKTLLFHTGSGTRLCIEGFTRDAGKCKVFGLSDGKLEEGMGTCDATGSAGGTFWQFSCEKDGRGCLPSLSTKIVMNGNQKDPLAKGQTKWSDRSDAGRYGEIVTKTCKEVLTAPASDANTACLTLVDPNAKDTACAAETDEAKRVACMLKTYDAVVEIGPTSKRCYSFDAGLASGSYVTPGLGTAGPSIKPGAMTQTYSLKKLTTTYSELRLSSGTTSTLSFVAKPDYAARAWSAKYDYKITFETKGYCAAGFKEPAPAATGTGPTAGTGPTTTAPTTTAPTTTAPTTAAPATQGPAAGCAPATPQQGNTKPNGSTSPAAIVVVDDALAVTDKYAGAVAVGFRAGAPVACAVMTGATCTFKAKGVSDLVGAACGVGFVKASSGTWSGSIRAKAGSKSGLFLVPNTEAPTIATIEFKSKTGTEEVKKAASCPF